MAYSSTNYTYEKVLSKFQTFLRSEFGGALPVYIGEEYEKTRNSHLRLFVNQITDIDSKHKMILNQVDIEISIYLNIISNKSIALDKLTDITNRVEQVLYENKRDGSNYFDGQVADIEFNIKNDEEELVDNMMLSRINYNVKIPLAYKLFGFFLDSDNKNFITANNKKFVILN